MELEDRGQYWYLPKVLASSNTASSCSPVISFFGSLFVGCEALLCFAGGEEKGSRWSMTTFSFVGLEDIFWSGLDLYLPSYCFCLCLWLWLGLCHPWLLPRLQSSLFQPVKKQLIVDIACNLGVWEPGLSANRIYSTLNTWQGVLGGQGWYPICTWTFQELAKRFQGARPSLDLCGSMEAISFELDKAVNPYTCQSYEVQLKPSQALFQILTASVSCKNPSSPLRDQSLTQILIESRALVFWLGAKPSKSQELGNFEMYDRKPYRKSWGSLNPKTSLKDEPLPPFAQLSGRQPESPHYHCPPPGLCTSLWNVPRGAVWSPS